MFIYIVRKSSITQTTATRFQHIGTTSIRNVSHCTSLMWCRYVPNHSRSNREGRISYLMLLANIWRIQIARLCLFFIIFIIGELYRISFISIGFFKFALFRFRFISNAFSHIFFLHLIIKFVTEIEILSLIKIIRYIWYPNKQFSLY